MEGWRQRRPGSQEDHSTSKGNCKTNLTLTGLLMEGLMRTWSASKSPRAVDRVVLSTFIIPWTEQGSEAKNRMRYRPGSYSFPLFVFGAYLISWSIWICARHFI